MTQGTGEMATIKKRGDGWYVQVRRLGYTPLYRTFTSKAAGQRWAREQESLIDRQQAPTDLRTLRSVTLGDLIQRYRDNVTPRKRGAESETLRLRKMALAPMCALSLADLGPPAVAAYRDTRLLTVTPGTVRRELSLFRCIIDVAMREWGIGLPVNPVKGVMLPKANAPRERRLNRGDATRIDLALRQTRNPMLRPFIAFAIETAMRRGGLLSLEWGHIDLPKRTAHVPHTKTGTTRTIPLTDNALAILEGVIRDDGKKVFPITLVALRHAWDRLTERAGVGDLHIHDLRHEALSRFCELGLTIPELAVISGHKDPRMLFRYTHLRADDLARKLAGKVWVDHFEKPL